MPLADIEAFSSIVAQDMVLQEQYQCLPPVILDDFAMSLSTEKRNLVSVHELLAAMELRCSRLSHLDIRLDWWAMKQKFLCSISC